MPFRHGDPFCFKIFPQQNIFTNIRKQHEKNWKYCKCEDLDYATPKLNCFSISIFLHSCNRDKLKMQLKEYHRSLGSNATSRQRGLDLKSTWYWILMDKIWCYQCHHAGERIMPLSLWENLLVPCRRQIWRPHPIKGDRCQRRSPVGGELLQWMQDSVSRTTHLIGVQLNLGIQLNMGTSWPKRYHWASNCFDGC